MLSNHQTPQDCEYWMKMLFSKLLLGHPDPWNHPEFLALKDGFNLVLKLNPTTCNYSMYVPFLAFNIFLTLIGSCSNLANFQHFKYMVACITIRFRLSLMSLIISTFTSSVMLLSQKRCNFSLVSLRSVYKNIYKELDIPKFFAETLSLMTSMLRS